MHLLNTPETAHHRSREQLDADHLPARARSRRRRRAAGVGGGILAAVAVWTLAGPLLGVDLQVAPGTNQPQPVGVGAVITASLAAGLAGWASSALLERLTHRARSVWTGLALVVLVASLVPAQAGVTTATTVALAAMHLAVAAVVIPVMRVTSPSTRPGR